ncbi:penicillin-binding protein 2 [Bacteroidales bacterium OttesenSCG-928-I14]|nr:penicillin-binding protein 2 [Bacteroidales bacterium OttesenSCG-928-I14]
MSKNKLNIDARRRVLIIIILAVVLVYIGQLFRLQIVNQDYKSWADSNAYLNKIQHPSRGIMYDRNGKLLVYNQPAYDVMVVAREMQDFDTLAFCQAVNITPEYFTKRLADIKNRKLNPGYSSYTPQTFITQLGNREYGILQESIYKFPGFYIQNRTVREYSYPNAAHVLGYIAEADKNDLNDDSYYIRGDYIGKTGIEKTYEKHLRGEKGVEILLRDAHGRIKGKFEEGIHDVAPKSGRDLTLSLDIDLQAYGEELMKNKLGSIIIIEPKTGEVLCMVSSPTYDPSILVGRQFSTNFSMLNQDPYLPLYDRAMYGQYPPGSTFKIAQALTLLQENIITPYTAYGCSGKVNKPGCHVHGSPISLVPAIGTSCNAYFATGLRAMLDNKKYGSVQVGMDKWRDYMVAQGFGYRLGIDLPGEKRGLIPNSQYYDKKFSDKNGKPWWKSGTIVSIGIGQGEVALTPLQICNLAATVANRGYYYTPHVVKDVKGASLDSLYRTPHYTGINSKHYEHIIEGMRIAVVGGPYGSTCKNANIPDIAVCGKTGTAENIGKDHSIFMGFAPMDNPQLAIMVFVENGGYGATYAVPIGRLMIQKALKGFIPDEDKPIEDRIKNAVILRNVL